MVLHLMRLADAGRLWWVGCDEAGGRIVRGLAGGAKPGILKAWIDRHGVPDAIITHKGNHSKAEAAAMLADLALGA